MFQSLLLVLPVAISASYEPAPYLEPVAKPVSPVVITVAPEEVAACEMTLEQVLGPVALAGSMEGRPVCQAN